MGPGLAYFTDTLRNALKRLGPKDLRQARSMFEHYSRECQRLAMHEDPLSVAFTVHDLVDEQMRHMLDHSPHASRVQCRKGCANCCRMAVDIDAKEALLLRAFAAEQGLAIDEARLERQAVSTAPSAWRALAPEDQACVFLQPDDTCGVYEHRPSACRKHLVATDPDLCDIVKHPGGKVARVFAMEAEIVASAAMTTFGSASMARMLLASRPAATDVPPEPEKRAVRDPGAPAAHPS